jgi:hypothetical protein
MEGGGRFSNSPSVCSVWLGVVGVAAWVAVAEPAFQGLGLSTRGMSMRGRRRAGALKGLKKTLIVSRAHNSE